MILGKRFANAQAGGRGARSSSVAVRPVVVCNAGFGKTSSKKKDTSMKLGSKVEKEIGVAREGGAPNPVTASAAALGVDVKKGWKDCGLKSELFAKKDAKVVELAAGKAIVVFQYKGKVYCTDAYSTAYKYPLFDAKIFDNQAGKAVIEVPLDGTIYNLETGKVELWCPKDGNPIRSVLGALKKVSDPVDLPVYRVVESEGRVYARYYEGEY